MQNSTFRCSDTMMTMLFEAVQRGFAPRSLCAAPELSFSALYLNTLSENPEPGPGTAEHLLALLIQSGEPESVRPLFPELEHICEEFLKQLADGVSPFSDEESTESTPAELVSKALCARLTLQTAAVARNIGDRAAYERWSQAYQNLRTDFMLRYYRDNQLTVTTQSSMTLALFCGVAPENPDYWALAVDKLLHSLEKEHHLRITTGSMGTPALLPALCEVEALDSAWQLLRQTLPPNWCSEITGGAAKLWERSDLPGSPLHYPGSVAAWLMREAAGIRFENSFRFFRIAPHFGRFLNFVHAELPVKTGIIISDWERTKEGFELRFSVPRETRALVYGKNYPSGSYKINISQVLL